MKKRAPIRPEKWLVPVLAIASVVIAGSWLVRRDAAVSGAGTASSDPAATIVTDSFPEETPEPGIVLKAQGTWQDPAPEAMGVPDRTPMSPWHPPYDARFRDYRDGPWSAYRRHRGRHTSWMDAICPLPKHRPDWPGRPGYQLPMEQPDRPGYPDVLGPPPTAFPGPLGR